MLSLIWLSGLFVTTRPHTSDVLEWELGTFSYVLQPFARANQIEFLTNFWGRGLESNDFYEMIKENSQKRASAVLEILVKLNSPQMLEFTGIPSQLRLAAEAFPYKEKVKLEHFKSSTQSICIADFYRVFLDKQFDICLKKKLSRNHTSLVGLKKYRNDIGQYRSFLTTHQELALKALFDEKTVTALMKHQQKIDETSSSSQDEEGEDEGEERSDIVTQFINKKPHFVHHTYAEYLAAAFLSEKLKDNGCDPEVQKFFVAKLLVEDRYKVIRAFLDCFLRHSDHAPAKVFWAWDLKENRDARGRTLYHVAAEERNAGIVRFFSIRLCKNRDDGTVDNITESSNVPKSAISPAIKSPDIDLEDFSKTTPLMIAVCTRVLAMVKCFVDAGANIDERSENGLMPLHWALLGRAELDAVQYLVERVSDINLPFSPLFSALHRDVQFNVVECLVENNADVNAIVTNTTPLLRALRRGVQLDVLKLLVKKGAKIDFKTTTGVTPLYCALQHGVQLDVIKYLVDEGAQINCETNSGVTPLSCALRQYAELDVVRYLREQTRREKNRKNLHSQ